MREGGDWSLCAWRRLWRKKDQEGLQLPGGWGKVETGRGLEHQTESGLQEGVGMKAALADESETRK